MNNNIMTMEAEEVIRAFLGVPFCNVLTGMYGSTTMKFCSSEMGKSSTFPHVANYSI